MGVLWFLVVWLDKIKLILGVGSDHPIGGIPSGYSTLESLPPGVYGCWAIGGTFSDAPAGFGRAQCLIIKAHTEITVAYTQILVIGSSEYPHIAMKTHLGWVQYV